MVGDADGGSAAFDAYPFVGFGVFQIGRNVTHKIFDKILQVMVFEK
jgi:hypothetical protein